MRRFACARWLSALASTAALLVVPAGCANNAMVLRGQVQKFEQERGVMAQEHRRLQDRVVALDRDNKEYTTLVAQARQEVKMLSDRLAATNDQFRDANDQLTQAKEALKSSDHRVQALTASMRRQGGVAITPNNSLLRSLPAINLPGVHVRRDGNVIRIELPGRQLFESGSARLSPGGTTLIADAAAEVLGAYPDQIVGVEGYTDSDPVTGGQWPNNHALSVARASAVFDVLASRTRYTAAQLFITGHGANHPVASNATLEGKQRNRRVELVVYPDKKG